MFQALMATGNIRAHQIGFATLHALYFFGSYFALCAGMQASLVFLLGAVQEALMMCWRVWLLKRQIGFSVRMYFHRVFLPAGAVLAVSSTVPAIIFVSLNEGWGRLISVGSVSVFCSILAIYFIGMTTRERAFICEKIRNRFFA